MARSASLRNRPAPEPAAAEPAAPDTPLDSAADAVNDYRSGEVAQGDDPFIETLARRAKWTPKEEWTRAPDKWVDARAYLERLPDELETVKDRLRRTSQAAADAIEEERRQARIEAQNEIRAAAEAQDPERAARAAQQLERVAGPPPTVTAWIARNEWFTHDPAAHALAAAVSQRLAAAGASTERQLEEAEAEVRRRFPEHFGQAERPPTEPPPAGRRAAPIPPAVQAGTRSADSRPREKGFADIPGADRALFEQKLRKRFEARLGSKDAAEKQYAASYWRNKDQ